MSFCLSVREVEKRSPSLNQMFTKWNQTQWKEEIICPDATRCSSHRWPSSSRSTAGQVSTRSTVTRCGTSSSLQGINATLSPNQRSCSRGWTSGWGHFQTDACCICPKPNWYAGNSLLNNLLKNATRFPVFPVWGKYDVFNVVHSKITTQQVSDICLINMIMYNRITRLPAWELWNSIIMLLC